MKCPKFISNVLKPFSCGMLIGCLCLTSTPIYSNASASTEGNRKYVTVNNVQFTMYNSADTLKLNNKKYAYASTTVTAEQMLQAGFLGAEPILYYSNGNVAFHGELTYSSDNSGTYSGVTSISGFTDSPAVYSCGYAYIWNGINYHIKYQPDKTGNLSNYT
ncbi:MAG: hypothetical protein K2K91_07805 [Ruminococcus sp.]|nr:hypothetical protein [Ruminococcus sp.]MDE7097902.1 hypothetical protein [Ruminococcus sp.]